MIKRKRARHICVTNDSRVIRVYESIDFRIVFFLCRLGVCDRGVLFFIPSRVAGREKLVLNLSWPIINHHHHPPNYRRLYADFMLGAAAKVLFYRSNKSA